MKEMNTAERIQFCQRMLRLYGSNKHGIRDDDPHRIQKLASLDYIIKTYQSEIRSLTGDLILEDVWNRNKK